MARLIRNPSRYGRELGSRSGINDDQISRVGGSGKNDLEGFFLKLDFTMNCKDGPRRRLKSLTRVWSSKEFLPLENSIIKWWVLFPSLYKNIFWFYIPHVPPLWAKIYYYLFLTSTAISSFSTWLLLYLC